MTPEDRAELDAIEARARARLAAAASRIATPPGTQRFHTPLPIVRRMVALRLATPLDSLGPAVDAYGWATWFAPRWAADAYLALDRERDVEHALDVLEGAMARATVDVVAAAWSLGGTDALRALAQIGR